MADITLQDIIAAHTDLLAAHTEKFLPMIRLQERGTSVRLEIVEPVVPSTASLLYLQTAQHVMSTYRAYPNPRSKLVSHYFVARLSP